MTTFPPPVPRAPGAGQVPFAPRRPAAVAGRFLAALAALLSATLTPLAADPELHEAVQRGDHQRVRALLDAHPERVNETSDRYDQCTPLHLAVRRRNTDLVILLVERGADVNRVNKFGLAPLDLALGYGLDALQDFLGYHGARPLHREEALTRPGPRTGSIALRGSDGTAPIRFHRGSERRIRPLAPDTATDPALPDGSPPSAPASTSASTSAAAAAAAPASAPPVAPPNPFTPGSRNLRAGTGGFLVNHDDAPAPDAATHASPSRDLEITDGSEAFVRGNPVVLQYDASADRTIDDLPADERSPVAFEFVNEDDREHRLAFSFVDAGSRLTLESDQAVTLPPPGPGFPTIHIREGTTIHLDDTPGSARFYVLLPPQANLRIVVDPTSTLPALPPAPAPDAAASAAAPTPSGAGTTRTFVPNPFPFGGSPFPQAAPAPPPEPTTPPATGPDRQ